MSTESSYRSRRRTDPTNNQGSGRLHLTRSRVDARQDGPRCCLRGRGGRGGGRLADSVSGAFEASAGSASVIAVCAAHQEPLVLPTRGELDERFTATLATWRRRIADRRYEGPWQGPVMRSALTLKLLVQSASGTLAAAATTSLPEQIGGVRNWDYRFCWVRDAALTPDALQLLGCAPEARADFARR
jgi:GH15 family glucan-1,4-alpha-glucosidase